MEVELVNRPSSTVAKVTLHSGEHFIAEGGSMIAMNGSMRIETSTYKRGQGNVFKALKRMLTGESFFLNHYYSSQSKDELWLSHPLPGDMDVIHVEKGAGIVVAGGSFVACEDNVEMDMSWQGMKSFFTGENLFWLKMSGEGPLVVSSYGSIYKVKVQDGYVVDTGHVVAFEDTLDFKITKAGSSWWHSFLGGEGLVMEFAGRGSIWCQSHNANEFGRLVGPLLKPRKQ
ncbi:MAG: TIGR00266 family protein [Bdellovibrionaceae bacterium]|nr:TIGR00266 family protein [Pseudobdellovibrionaceae bacterium]